MKQWRAVQSIDSIGITRLVAWLPLYKGICRVPKCERAHYAKGYCEPHYRQRLRKRRRQAERTAGSASYVLAPLTSAQVGC